MNLISMERPRKPDRDMLNQLDALWRDDLHPNDGPGFDRLLDDVSPPALSSLNGYDFRRAHREAEDPERFDGMS